MTIIFNESIRTAALGPTILGLLLGYVLEDWADAMVLYMVFSNRHTGKPEIVSNAVPIDAYQ
ncbi:hypothetical protein SGCOL_008979 [Colletotrichum sp. CLE4]